jgi:hypothetical protein
VSKKPPPAPQPSDGPQQISLVLAPVEEYRDFSITPEALFGSLARVADEEDWNVLAYIDHFRNNESVGNDLNAPAFRMLHGLLDMLMVLARPHWGEPDYLVNEQGGRVPDWMELYLYPNGVPVTLHYLVGWKRQNKRNKPMAVIAYIDESNGGSPGSWGLSLMLGVHELDVADESAGRRGQPRPARAVSAAKAKKKRGRAK